MHITNYKCVFLGWQGAKRRYNFYYDKGGYITLSAICKGC